MDSEEVLVQVDGGGRAFPQAVQHLVDHLVQGLDRDRGVVAIILICPMWTYVRVFRISNDFTAMVIISCARSFANHNPRAALNDAAGQFAA
ncbi:hypothetical protein GU90_14860 [Saccharopolyspora rectivirgula]|jgi:hypothetical protein|uniref:Uncharacterized protein n=1 Tax=Saccharopolyspora rectivirgula TaxID=28042 RepID=A0A073AV35_9PSEU|nr:hypothetical protein GU90_14860 [Saccharopolyspora rectivirgula]